MAQGAKYNNYEFEKFEPKLVSTRTEAPKIKTVPKEREELKLVKKRRPSKRQIVNERRNAFFKTSAITIIAILCLAFFAFTIYNRVELDEINRQISSVEADMLIAESNTTKLQSELNSTISMDKVEEYAYNVLGMVKIQDFQVAYIDLSAEDKIMLANGKEVQNKEESNVINKDTK